MKLLTKEEERAHYYATLWGGTIGGVSGLAAGVAGVYLASRRFHFVNHLTLPLKAFLVTSTGTFAGIISADHASRSYEQQRNPVDREFKEMQQQNKIEKYGGMSFTERAMDFGKRERYKIVGASWVASMGIAFALVNRNKYLSGPQKLVQARVYAQFLTLGVLVASAAFEISDSHNEEGKMWETVKYVDPTDPERKRMLEKKELRDVEPHSDGDSMWKDMVAAEEQREKEADEERKRFKEEHAKKGSASKKGKQQEKSKDGMKEDKDENKDDKDDKKDDSSGGGNVKRPQGGNKG